MFAYVKFVLFALGALFLVAVAFGIGIIAIISALIVLPIIRFMLLRSAKQTSTPNKPKYNSVDVDYYIIDEQDSHSKKT